MKSNGYLEFPNNKYKVVINTDNQVAKELMKYLPISSKAQNIGGEIYFRANGVDLEYDGTETADFEIGDVVYWRSPDGEKIFSIAILYGNTSFGNWKSPRTFSPCVKIGKIVDDTYTLESIQSGEKVKFVLE